MLTDGPLFFTFLARQRRGSGRRAIYGAALIIALSLLVSACGGVNMSGEPRIIDEIEILPTRTPLPSPTPDATQAAQIDATATVAAEQGVALVDGRIPDMTLGRQLFLQACASCHAGQDGTGPALATMTENAASRIEGMDPYDYVYQSIVEPDAFLVEGYENVMPGGYAEQFDEYELRSMVRFVVEAQSPPPLEQALGTPAPDDAPDDAPDGAPDDAPDEAPAVAGAGETGGDEPVADDDAPAGAQMAVSGRLVQGSAGGEAIPAGLPLQLFVLDPHQSENQIVAVLETEASEGGAYEFAEVPRDPAFTYRILVQYHDVPQVARLADFQGDEERVVQDVTLYERTTERGSIRVRWAQMLVNFAPINEFGLEVWLTLELVNTGDRIVTTEEVAASGWHVSVPIELPVGAFGIQPMQSQDRFQVELVDNIPTVKDTWPLHPGQVHTLTIAYYLPYEDGAVLEHAFGYPVVDAAVLVPNDTVSFESEQFDDTGDWRYRVTGNGTRVEELAPGATINPDDDVTLVRAFDLLAPVGDDDRLQFTLDGRPSRTLGVIAATPTAATDDDDNLLPLALFAVGLSVLVLAGVLWWRQRAALVVQGAGGQAPVPVTHADAWQPPAPNAGKNAILGAIADLDDSYEAGQIDDATYQSRRAILVERLMPFMADD